MPASNINWGYMCLPVVSPSHVQVGSSICVVAHCLGEAQRKVFAATVKDLSYRTIRYDEAVPDGKPPACHAVASPSGCTVSLVVAVISCASIGCAGGAVLCDGRLVGVHIQNSFIDKADTALILQPLLKGRTLILLQYSMLENHDFHV